MCGPLTSSARIRQVTSPVWLNLPEDLYREVIDPRYMTRTHGNVSTSNRGCKGPLCRRAARENREALRRKQAESEGREYKPKPYKRKDTYTDEYLNEVLAWHYAIRARPDPTKEILDGMAERTEAVPA